MEIPEYLGIAQGGVASLAPLKKMLEEQGIQSRVTLPPGVNANS
jgi:hypothetical protein